MLCGDEKVLLLAVKRRCTLEADFCVHTGVGGALVIAGLVPFDLFADGRETLSRFDNGYMRDPIGINHVYTARKVDASGECGSLDEKIHPGYVEMGGKDVGPILSASFYLTGHDCFKVYLGRMRKLKEEGCSYCGERDTPQNLVLSVREGRKVVRVIKRW